MSEFKQGERDSMVLMGENNIKSKKKSIPKYLSESRKMQMGDTKKRVMSELESNIELEEDI